MTTRKPIKLIGKNKFKLQDVEKYYSITEYEDLVAIIRENVNNGNISPVVAQKTNGKNPSLYKAYRLAKEEVNYSDQLEEIEYKLSSLINIDYYRKNPDKYIKERKYILKFNEYLEHERYLLNDKISMYERSFEIWGEEKYLGRYGGKALLKNLGFDIKKLNIYDATEPLAYYSSNKITPQKILVLENKDIFYSMRKHLLEGNITIFGIEIGTLIYGGGKGVNKRFQDFDYCVEPYLANKDNTILYLGDIDYEGIVIYESLKQIVGGERNLIPFKEGYLAMLEKGLSNISKLPFTLEGQNRNIKKVFLNAFSDEQQEAIMKILEMNKYIPQEILTIRDF